MTSCIFAYQYSIYFIWKHHSISWYLDYCHWPLTRYAKLRVAHVPGMLECLPRHRLQWKPLGSDPGMHHGTCVTNCQYVSLIEYSYLNSKLTHFKSTNIKSPFVHAMSRRLKRENLHRNHSVPDLPAVSQYTYCIIMMCSNSTGKGWFLWHDINTYKIIRSQGVAMRIINSPHFVKGDTNTAKTWEGDSRSTILTVCINWYVSG